MNTRTSLSFIFSAALLTALPACGNSNELSDVGTRNTKEQAAQRTKRDANIEQDIYEGCTQYTDTFCPPLDTLADQQRFTDQIAAAKTQYVPANEPAAPVLAVEDFSSYVKRIVLTQFLDAHAAHPEKLTIDDAHSLAAVVSNYALAAIHGDVLGAFREYQAATREVWRIRQRNRGHALGLYDNSTIEGRILNFGNGIVDVFAQFYGSLLALDPSLAAGAVESLGRNFMNLISI